MLRPAATEWINPATAAARTSDQLLPQVAQSCFLMLSWTLKSISVSGENVGHVQVPRRARAFWLRPGAAWLPGPKSRRGIRRLTDTSALQREEMPTARNSCRGYSCPLPLSVTSMPSQNGTVATNGTDGTIYLRTSVPAVRGFSMGVLPKARGRAMPNSSCFLCGNLVSFRQACMTEPA
jgi:hypothetical protein